MAQGPINLSLFGSKVARGTPNRVFAIFFFSNPLITIWQNTSKNSSYQNKAYQMPSKLKKKKRMRQGKRKEREGEKAKSESRKCCAVLLLKPKTMSKFCFLRMPKFASTWLKRPRSVQPGNGFVGRFSS